MQSTMQDFPLTVGMIFRHGRALYPGSAVVTNELDHVRRATFAEVAERVERLARALRRLGVDVGDRVGTLAWNIQEHLESYFAIPGIGAVLHTLNPRLFPEQLGHIVNHAEDRVIIIDGSLIPILEPLVKDLGMVEHYIVIGDADAAALEAAGGQVHRYDEMLEAVPPGYEWPEIDERAAAAMCYTSGTTGNPKGVVYSHRSTFLHSMCLLQAGVCGFTDHDRVLPVVPLFHANGWGTPYAAWLSGADLLLPNRYTQPAPLAAFIESERATWSGATPVIWNDLLQYADDHPVDLSSLRQILCGGSAVPLTLMKAFQERFGVNMLQAWGMTETGPLAAAAHLPKGVEQGDADEWRYRTASGRVVPGVDLRIVGDDGAVLPWDSNAVGEIQVRGPWISGSYHRDPAPEKFDDGWLRTGDIATMEPGGYVRITDRTKDVIKSGGEWISSVELEGHLAAHPDVAEATVIAVPDARWGERPLACVVLRPDASVGAAELRAFLGDSIAAWQLPERWAFIDEVPKTSVGKFDKKLLRARYADGELVLEEIK